MLAAEEGREGDVSRLVQFTASSALQSLGLLLRYLPDRVRLVSIIKKIHYSLHLYPWYWPDMRPSSNIYHPLYSRRLLYVSVAPCHHPPIIPEIGRAIQAS